MSPAGLEPTSRPHCHRVRHFVILVKLSSSESLINHNVIKICGKKQLHAFNVVIIIIIIIITATLRILGFCPSTSVLLSFYTVCFISCLFVLFSVPFCVFVSFFFFLCSPYNWNLCCWVCMLISNSFYYYYHYYWYHQHHHHHICILEWHNLNTILFGSFKNCTEVHLTGW